jgi:hypothetical protein
MRFFQINKVYLGNIDIEKALNIAYSDKTLKQTHGNDAKISDWKNGKKQISFYMDSSTVPMAVRKLVVGDKILVDAEHCLMYSAKDKKEIEATVKMNCVASRFMTIQPRFIFSANNGETFFDASVKVNFWSPQPIKNVIESFMVLQAEKDILQYSQAIVDNCIRL